MNYKTIGYSIAVIDGVFLSYLNLGETRFWFVLGMIAMAFLAGTLIEMGDGKEAKENKEKMEDTKIESI
jgi:hypothetical protein